MASRFTIVGLGEALFDVFPDRSVLGGAPLNVAVHAHQLAAPLEGRGVVVSRVGHDDLGRQVRDELTGRGMSVEFLQTDPDRDTGRVYVDLSVPSAPKFDIVRDVAWDKLQWDPDLEDLARRCEAVCFGTLAQRDAQSRTTIYRFLDSATRAVRMFDVNLRQNYYDARILRRSCESCTVVKLNEEELPIVAEQLGIGAGTEDPGLKGPAWNDAAADRLATALLKKFRLQMVALTRAERGTVLFTAAGRLESPAVSYPLAAGADSVGAGDACSAGLLVGLVQRMPLEKTLALANHAGAFVASQPGATPALPAEVIRLAGG